MRSARSWLVAVALAASSACATKTSTTQLWQAEDFAPSTLRHVVVFARAMPEPQRRAFEDALATRLADHGVAATPSYRIFPEPPERDRARAELARQGYDGVIVTTLRSVRERQSYRPGYYAGGGFWGAYYGSGWGWFPGDVVTDEIVDAETSVWDLRIEDGRLVWSALTETTNPANNDDLTRSMTNEVVPRIERAGIIPSRR